MQQVNSRIKNASRNICVGFVSQFFLLFLNFISRTIFIKLFGTDYLGINGLYSNILVMLSLAELGIGNVMTFCLYQPLYEKNHSKINAYLLFFKKCYIAIALVIVFLGILCIPFLQYIVNSNLDNNSIIIYYLLFLMDSICSYFLIYKTTLIIADQKTYIITSYKTGWTFLLKIVQIICMLTTKKYELYIFIQVIFTLLCNWSVSKKAEKIYPYINKKIVKTTLSIDEKKIVFVKIKAQSIFKLGWAILNCTDNILISMMLGTVYVGYYSNYYIFISAISSFIAVITQSVISSVGNLAAEGNREKSYSVFKILVMFFHFFTAVIFINFCMVFNTTISLWLGSEFLLSKVDVLLISLNFYIQNIINPVWMYREAMGLFEKVKYIMLITAGLNVIFSIIGGFYLGVGGIIFATGFARVCTTVWYEPRLLFKTKFGRNVREYALMQFKFMGFTAISYIGSLFAMHYISGTTIVALILKIISCSCITGVVFFIGLQKSYEFIQCKIYILKNIKKR